MEDEILDFGELNLSEGSLSDYLNDNDDNEDPKTDVPTTTVDTSKDKEDNEPEVNEDPEDTEVKPTIKETKTETAPSGDNESSTFSVFAKMLQEEGVVDLEPEQLSGIKTSEDLKRVMSEYIQKAKFEGLNDSQKRYLGAVEAGIPKSEFDELEKDLVILEQYTEDVLQEDQKARFNLIALNFMNKGFTKDKAIKLANQSFAAKTDLEDAIEARADIYSFKKEAYDSKVSSKVEEQKMSVEKLKETIDSKETILNEVKLTPKMKENIHRMLVTKVDTDDVGNPINEFNKWRNENGVEAEIILTSLYNLTNGFKSLGKLKTTAITKASKELESRLQQTENKDFNQSNSSVMFNGEEVDFIL